MIYIELKRQKNIIKPHSKDADYNKYKLIYLIPVNKEISYSPKYIYQYLSSKQTINIYITNPLSISLIITKFAILKTLINYFNSF